MDAREALMSTGGAAAVLRLYGLDQMLTEQDDPALWAAMLIQHWPAPSSPDMDPPALRFGIGRIVDQEANQGQVSSRSGMQELETWCFERVDADHLRVVQCQDRPAVSFMFAMAMATGGDRSLLDDPQSLRGRLYLDVSRPSRGEEQALVHAGISTPPNAGTGEVRCWRVNERGEWKQTKEVVSRWLT